MTRKHEAIIAVNAGSSSIKFALFTAAAQPLRSHSGQIEGIGAAAKFTVRGSGGEIIAQREFDAGVDHAAALSFILHWIDTESHAHLVAAGHRVVHGGESYAAPARINAATLAELEKFVPLAPLHQPHNLSAIRAMAELRPSMPQLACFDTSFHRTQPHLAQLFALPRALTALGIRRYGFHGLSYEYVSGALHGIIGETARGRVIVAHLGNGASLCALRDGRSIATSMGFSTLDGLMMGTRSGSLDPGVILYLLQQGYDEERLTRLLYRESGLLGVSGLSSDMRDLLASRSPEAKEAVELFVYRVVRDIGSLAAALGGLDALVFTGGIGEHAAPVRRAVCEQSAWLGITIDEARNVAGGPRISRADGAGSAWVIATDEELVIARHTLVALVH